MWIFHVLLWMHVVTGAVGLLALWPPMLGRKGGPVHKRWGKVFAYCLLATGFFAIGMSLCTLAAPLETHPKLSDIRMIRGLFGYMMLYLATFTMTLAWYGLACIRHKQNHRRHRNIVTLGSQGATLATAILRAVQGWLGDQPLMIGISSLGIIAATLNTLYIVSRDPPRNEWLVQHMRALVGAGVSIYTAFFSFGAANLLPAVAFNPVLWATPTLIGIGVIGYHQTRLRGQWPMRRPARSGT